MTKINLFRVSSTAAIIGCFVYYYYSANYTKEKREHTRFCDRIVLEPSDSKLENRVNAFILASKNCSSGDYDFSLNVKLCRDTRYICAGEQSGICARINAYCRTLE